MKATSPDSHRSVTFSDIVANPGSIMQFQHWFDVELTLKGLFIITIQTTNLPFTQIRIQLILSPFLVWVIKPSKRSVNGFVSHLYFVFLLITIKIILRHITIVVKKLNTWSPNSLSFKTVTFITVEESIDNKDVFAWKTNCLNNWTRLLYYFLLKII